MQNWWSGVVDGVNFIGEVVLALLAFVRGRAKFRVEDVARVFAAAGPQALPIVTLIGLLAGFILAFVGGNELELFGAQIYVANLVTTGMAQEMGPLMAAVIMAGRTGAAFAAELGTMQVNQETDALRTLAVDPVQYLVVPRMLALMLMLPLLACYAMLMGILGGGDRRGPRLRHRPAGICAADAADDRHRGFRGRHLQGRGVRGHRRGGGVPARACAAARTRRRSAMPPPRPWSPRSSASSWPTRSST